MKSLKSYGKLTVKERQEIRDKAVFTDEFYYLSSDVKGGGVYYDDKRKMYFVVTAITSPGKWLKHRREYFTENPITLLERIESQVQA